MREERLREKEGSLTFKPVITKQASIGAENASNESRFEKLYSEAKKRKEAAKDLSCTFKPTITPRAQNRQRSATPEGSSQRLYDAPGAGRPRRSSSADKKNSRRSFSPQITKRGKSIERTGSLSSPTTRLYSQAQSQKENHQALAYKLNKESSKECTFTPKTNASVEGTASLKSPSIPVAERMEKYLALREKRLKELKEKQLAQEAQSATFKPVSYTSKRSKSAERRRVSDANSLASSGSALSDRGSPDGTVTSVFDRLNAPYSKKPVTIEDKDKHEYTYKPKLVTKRAPSPQRLEETSKYGDVYNRLYQKGNESRLASELRNAEIRREVEKEHTFSPNLPSQRSSPESPSKGAVFERLAANRQHMHGVLNEVKTEFEMDNCTFHPEINRFSDEISGKKVNKPAYLRLMDKAKQLHEEKLKLEAKKQEEELVDCTFSPAIDKNSQKVLLKRPSRENVFERLSSSGSIVDNSPNPEINAPKVIRKPGPRGGKLKPQNSGSPDSPPKESVFERLAATKSRSRSPPVQENQPANVPNTKKNVTRNKSKDDNADSMNGTSSDVHAPEETLKQESLLMELAEESVTISQDEEKQLQNLLSDKVAEHVKNQQSQSDELVHE